MKEHITSRGRREWWDDVEIGLDSDAPIIMGQTELSRFEWNTPEHLPNSPLCPLIQKQKWGDTGNGSGICVYHGRKQRVGNPIESS